MKKELGPRLEKAFVHTCRVLIGLSGSTLLFCGIDMAATAHNASYSAEARTAVDNGDFVLGSFCGAVLVGALMVAETNRQCGNRDTLFAADELPTQPLPLIPPDRLQPPHPQDTILSILPADQVALIPGR